MKKSIVLFILFLGVFFNSQAQDTLDVAVDHFCECIVAKQDSMEKYKVKLDAMTELQNCLLGVFLNDNNVIKAKYGEDFRLNAETGEMLGEEIGFRAALKCPTYIKFISQSEELMDIVKDEMNDEKDVEKKTLTKKGKLDGVKLKPWFTVTLDNDGRKEKYVVVKNGNGVADFVANYKKYVGKEISIEYSISEIYNAEQEEFELKKEILSIKIEK